MTTTSSSLRCRKFCSVSACGLPAKDSALDYSPRPAAPACTSTARTVSLDLCAWLSPESIALNAQPQLAAACGRLERSEGNHGPGNPYARHSMDRGPRRLATRWPIGYWKGSGLALLLDVIAATLSGGAGTLAHFQLPPSGSGERVRYPGERVLETRHDSWAELRWSCPSGAKCRLSLAPA